ncbi:sugar phosphate isomerase/epimerase family protein [Kitasatospora arboriphila]
MRIFTFLTAKAGDSIPAKQEALIRQTVGDWPISLAAVENEYVCHVRTLPELEDFTTASGLSAIVDPCNHLIAADNDGLSELTARLVGRTVDVHVKDRKEGRYVPVGQGDLRWAEIFERLRNLGYTGTVTLESHLRGDLEGIGRSITALREWVAL